MIILAVDTSLAACSAAVYDTELRQIRAAKRDFMDKGHAEALAAMVHQVIAISGVAFSELDRVAVTLGPGTFTGVRIGLSFALGLGIAWERPVIGVTTLKALAANVNANSPNWPRAAAIDAKRGKVYFQIFSGDLREQSLPQCCTLAEAAAQLPEDAQVVGSASSALASLARGSNVVIAGDAELSFPDSSVIARLAADMPIPSLPPRPLYLRQSDAHRPAEKQSPVMGGTKIISAREEHASILAALHSECFREAWNAMEFARLLAIPGALALIVASGQNEPLGFILARKASDEAEIITIGVLPSHRRRHLATRLVAHAANELAGLGVRTMFIEVAQSNDAACALYLKLGFVNMGVRENYYQIASGTERHAFTMALPLRNVGYAG